ncbi:lysophospholipid acyltransferase family protein [Streptococcus merionis]|uniref:lysophospholipid acyltransferase family protein n=1 Tax=Streptococcus merionis TaxID=400065 RepID=UPI0035141AEC
MFYAYLRTLVSFLLWIVNGNIHYHNKERLLPNDVNYVYIAPHRTFWDPVFMAYAVRPKQFVVMAKKELFTNRIFAWWIRMCGAFPVDRDKPSTDAIRYPINALKKTNKSLLMFPSGSRHSTDVKGGVAVIAKMAKVKIQPAVYVGPTTFKGLLKRERVDMNFGEPIDISDIKRMNDEGIAEVSRRIQASFDALDAEMVPVHDNKKPNPLMWLLWIPAALLAVVWLLFTAIFSLFSSFIWNPEKHQKLD